MYKVIALLTFLSKDKSCLRHVSICKIVLLILYSNLLKAHCKYLQTLYFFMLSKKNINH